MSDTGPQVGRIDVEQVFDICEKDIPILIETLRKIIKDLR
jgi:uncharacterized protein with HEPN domain